jgi:hypothetical protein
MYTSRFSALKRICQPFVITIPELIPDIMTIPVLLITRSVRRIEENKIISLGTIDNSLKVAASKNCLTQSGSTGNKNLLSDCPSSLLTTIPNIEVAKTVMAPHSLKAGAIKV